MVVSRAVLCCAVPGGARGFGEDLVVGALALASIDRSRMVALVVGGFLGLVDWLMLVLG